ncbi:MAG: MarR family transcriptional regulator [Methanobrevibacter sp.]|uniref:MarR family winged helix-turn-helix transcriptional regulator n=1 Tax=Methanobrevibacter sp. TaxID=66852 RepID=UPI0025FB5110|nr:MarR family transcriptional regulator [Methanobrevibacter sp.]MBQ6100541.1 MarR family transcriptional regulator [Methanobrevibacter sp.]
MDMINRVEKIDFIPLFPALTLILKGHTKFFEKKLEGTNVTPSELPYILKVCGDNGNISQRDLSEIFSVSEPVVTRTLKNLENKGFIIRTKGPNNKTRRLLSLTEEGFEISEKMLNINDEWLEELFKDMYQADIDKFNGIIKSLTVNSLKL